MFSPGFGRTRLNLGKGVEGGGRGGWALVKARSGVWPSQWPYICWWLAGVLLSKAGGRGGGFEDQIILLLTAFLQLFQLVWMFCVDMAPDRRSPCYVHACGPRWDCLGVNCGYVFANTVRLFYMNENDYVISVFEPPVIRLTKVFVGYV